jgi:hypothetical protein
MPDNGTGTLDSRLEAAAMSQLEDAEANAKRQGIDLPPRQPASDSGEPGDETIITVDGQQKTIGDLKKEHMLQADYTKKTQGVSAREAEYKAKLEEFNNYQVLVNQYFDDSPEDYQRFVDYWKAKSSPDGAPPQNDGENGKGKTQEGQKPAVLQNRKYDEGIATMKKRMDDMEKQFQDRLVTEAVSMFRGQHPEIDDEMMNDIIDKATAPGAYDRSKDVMGNLTSAFDSLNKWSERGQKTAEEARMQKLKAQTFGGGTQASDSGAASMSELLRQAGTFKGPAQNIFPTGG